MELYSAASLLFIKLLITKMCEWKLSLVITEIVLIISWLFVPQRKLLQPEEETEEEKQFRVIYQQIAGDVSTQREEMSSRQWSEDDHVLMKLTQDKCECLSVCIWATTCNKLFKTLHQDMQICASELKTIMENVLAKRKHAGKNDIQFTCSFLCNHAKLPFPTDSDIKTDGFSLETCRSMIALMDVSFHWLYVCIVLYYILWIRY